jgi:hypothetical protein
MSVQVVSKRLPPVRGGAAPFFAALFALPVLGGLWLQGRPEFVAWELARDHRLGLSERKGDKVWSSEPAVVSDWLERRGTPVPPLPSRAGTAGLVGARYCALVDRVAAHVLYQGEESSVSLFVVTGPLRARAGWSARVDGLHLRLLRAVGRTLVVIGDDEEDVRQALRAFATTVARASPAAGARVAVDPAPG